jgi:membrane-associated phospholipid phosphatase
MVLAYLPCFVSNIGKKGRILLRTLPSVYVGVVALSRIIAGAHYLTDVTFSMIFTLILIELVVWVIKIKHKQVYPNISIVEENE